MQEQITSLRRAFPVQYHVKNSVVPAQAQAQAQAQDQDQSHSQSPGRAHKVVAVPSWVFEQSRLEESTTRFRLLARVLVAKIARSQLLASSMWQVDVDVLQGSGGSGSGGAFTCRTWVRDSMKRLEMDGVLAVATSDHRGNDYSGCGGRGVDWEQIERVCRWYVAEKKE